MFDINDRSDLDMHYLKELIILGLCKVENFNCFTCNVGNVKFTKGKIRHGVNGYPRCINRDCRTWISPFTLPYFKNTKLTYSKVYFTLYSYVSSDSNTQLAEYFDVSRTTLAKFHSYYNSVILNSYDATEKLPGSGIFECDECHLYTRKNNRGRFLRGQQSWVLGVINRTTKQLRLKIVTIRNTDEISNFLFDNITINGETVFMTDGWRGYNFLNDYNVTFNVINHSIRFVDLVDASIHTNTIERVWRSLREFIPKGLDENYIEYRVKAFIVFFNENALNMKDKMRVLIREIKKLYDL